jgi:hypothetical protein
MKVSMMIILLKRITKLVSIYFLMILSIILNHLVLKLKIKDVPKDVGGKKNNKIKLKDKKEFS